MLTYWTMFFTPALLALGHLRVSRSGWAMLGSALALLIGLRYQVGGDWTSYLSYFDFAASASLGQVLAQKDPGYQLLNWIAVELGADVWLVNLMAAIAFVAGLVRFVRYLPEPVLAFAVSIPYMAIVMAMGYSRQAMAFGMVLWGLTYLMERRILGFVVMLTIAASFHKSAVILIPLAILANTKRRLWTAVWVAISGLLLYWLFLAEKVAGLWDTYVTSGYAQASQGGPIRVALNVVPAIIFLLWRERFAMAREEKALWFWISAFSLGCLPLVFISATAVDRVALYFMPIQLVVASHIPKFFRRGERILPRAAVLGFYGLVLYVWLNYAGHATYWLPYQFWPFA